MLCMNRRNKSLPFVGWKPNASAMDFFRDGMEIAYKKEISAMVKRLHKPRSGHILRSHRKVSNRLREGVEIVAAALLWREFHCVLWCWKTSSDFDTIEVHTPLRFRRHRWISFLLRYVQYIPVKDVAARDRSCRCP